ncbi:hypothetical protein C2S51_021134, partial [Perilla frutescens var. frutescens]
MLMPIRTMILQRTALYLFLVSDLFHDSRDQLIINRTSNLSDTTLGVSIGYFLLDLTMIFYYYPALGGLDSQAQIYILMILFTESTTPFVNLRWYLDVAGLKNSKLYVYNGVALLLGWL